jgi:spore coat protein U-like protein
MKKLLIAAVASTAFISSTAFAQSSTDSVDFDVNATVNEQCHIQDPADVNFGTITLENSNVPGPDSLTLNNGSQNGSTQSIWVSCNYGAQLTASSANGGLFNAAGAALVANDPNDFTDVIEYRVRLTSTDNSIPLFEFQTDGPGSTGPVVAGGAFHNQATLRVYLDADDTPKRPVAGDYTDVATLTVGPV